MTIFGTGAKSLLGAIRHLEGIVESRRDAFAKTLPLLKPFLPEHLYLRWARDLLDVDTANFERLEREFSERLKPSLDDSEGQKPKVDVDFSLSEEGKEKVAAGTHRWVYTHDPNDGEGPLQFFAVPLAEGFDSKKRVEVRAVGPKGSRRWEIHNPDKVSFPLFSEFLEVSHLSNSGRVKFPLFFQKQASK